MSFSSAAVSSWVLNTASRSCLCHGFSNSFAYLTLHIVYLINRSLSVCTSESETGFGGPGESGLTGAALAGDDSTPDSLFSRFDRSIKPAFENLLFLTGVRGIIGDRTGVAFGSSGGGGGGGTAGSEGVTETDAIGAGEWSFSLPLSLSNALDPVCEAAAEPEPWPVFSVPQPLSETPHDDVAQEPSRAAGEAGLLASADDVPVFEGPAVDAPAGPLRFPKPGHRDFGPVGLPNEPCFCLFRIAKCEVGARLHSGDEG